MRPGDRPDAGKCKWGDARRPGPVFWYYGFQAATVLHTSGSGFWASKYSKKLNLCVVRPRSPLQPEIRFAI
jgi:hypothetical protein